jgi:serine/threonine protein kinase
MAIDLKIDGYDSFEQIAVGGMAAVYKARKISIDKTVAIKVLFPYLASDESFIDRFQREAKSAAQVQHENIVNILDFGESHGSYFIVMEFYEGFTLADLLKEQGRIPLDVAVTIIHEVCLGLEAAHAQGIIHRDVKPANVIYTDRGTIKIADFGLAKKSDTVTVVTQAGKVLGTPAYMSPEQAAGEAVGPQSDIFSLGVVAFEMLCQKRPFEGNSYSEVIEKIQTHQVPNLAYENPLVQPDFQKIIERMLEKDATRRYADVAAVIADLERAMEAVGISRDRRRLQRYFIDPVSYEQHFNETTISKCLSQGTYFMQKGKTHINEAIQEFKRILYIDPSNERARKHLAKLMADHPDGNVTVELDASKMRGTRSAAKKSQTQSTSRAGARPPAGGKRSSGARRRWAVLVPALLLAVAAGAWWGWQSLLARDDGAPVVLTPPRHEAVEGETLEFDLTVSDPDGDPVTVSSTNLPKGAQLSPAGHFKWVIGYQQAGRHPLDFVASDGHKSGRARTVIDVADKPVKLSFEKPAKRKAAVGDHVVVELQAASEIGNPVGFDIGRAPAGMKVDGDRVTWTPDRNQTGTYEVPIRGSDGVAEATQTLVVEVSPKDGLGGRTGRQQRQTGRVEWVLPKLANIYVDGKLKVREDTYLSIELPVGRHDIRAELLDGMTVFDKTVDVKEDKRITLAPPKVAYGRLSVYFLGAVGEFYVNGKKFEEQPPFTGVVMPAGKYEVSCKMFRDADTRSFEITVVEGKNTVIEYEIGHEPAVSYEKADS